MGELIYFVNYDKEFFKDYFKANEEPQQESSSNTTGENQNSGDGQNVTVTKTFQITTVKIETSEDDDVQDMEHDVMPEPSGCGWLAPLSMAEYLRRNPNSRFKDLVDEEACYETPRQKLRQKKRAIKPKIFECPYCDARYAYAGALKNHVQSRHDLE